jgi:branched-chain amino acid transport system ATP-binding protein
VSLLSVDQLHVAYGGLVVVKGISFNVKQGEIITMLGGNGAGKTTTLRAIAGLLRPASGSIRFAG